MPSIKCPYCDNRFEWSTDVGEGRAEGPLCGKAIQIVRKTGRKQRAEPSATTTWGTEGFRSDERREEYGGIQKGDVLGGFRVDEMLGAGAMAVVYKATQLSLDRPVALKILPVKYAHNETFVRQFDSETELLASLNHPNIVNIIDRGREGDTYFFAMEYVEGTTLGELVATGEVEEEFFLDIMEGCCKALAYAHSRGIIHRDIKPANIMLNDQGMPKVADFGIAGMMAEAETDNRSRRRVMGTRGYMPPEQEEDVRNTDERSDIFALGAVMYRVLTGRVPDDLPPRPPSQVAPEVDPGIDSLVLKCLEEDPERRYQGAGELLEMLQAYRRQITRMGEVCPQCKSQNPVTEKTCLNCGHDLSELFDVCPECGEENRIDVDICRSCGASLSTLRHQQSVRISRIEEQARSLALHHDYAEAIEHLQEVLQVKGKLFERARGRARRMMETYAKEREDYHRERVKYAKRLIGEGKLERALEVLQSVPEDVEAADAASGLLVNAKSRQVVAQKKVQQARKLLEKQDYDAAREALDEAAGMWEGCPDLEETRRQLQNALETARMLDYELAEVKDFIKQGKFKEAREAIQFAVSTMPDNPQVKALVRYIDRNERAQLVRNTLAEAKKAYQAGDYRRAVQSWTTVLDMLPEGDKRRKNIRANLSSARDKLADTGIVMLQPAQVVPLQLYGRTESAFPIRLLLILLFGIMGAIMLVGVFLVLLIAGG